MTGDRTDPVPEVVRLPADRAVATHVERGSRFLALVDRCASADRGLAVRDVERRRTPDATHHVYALRLADGAARYDDDGEPAGTAGRPILAALETSGVVDVVCVVTRYFGGTKLGTGGLARAYSRAAALALSQLPTRQVLLAEIRHVRYEFGDTGIVARVLAAHGAVRGGDEFSAVVRTELRVPAGTGERLGKALLDATGGRATLEPRQSPRTAWIAAET